MFTSGSRLIGPALSAAILFLTPNLFALQSPAPLVSIDAQHFATMWRGVSLELANLRCASIECVDGAAKLQALGASFEKGSNPAALFTALKSTWHNLDAILKRDMAKDYGRGTAEGTALFANAKASVSGPSSADRPIGGSECHQQCDSTMVIVLAVCSILPPPFNVLCVGGAIAAYLSCIEACNSSDSGDALPSAKQQAPEQVPDPVTATQLRSAAPRLLLRFTPAELAAAINFLSSQQGVQ